MQWKRFTDGYCINGHVPLMNSSTVNIYPWVRMLQYVHVHTERVKCKNQKSSLCPDRIHVHVLFYKHFMNNFSQLQINTL